MIGLHYHMRVFTRLLFAFNVVKANFSSIRCKAHSNILILFFLIILKLKMPKYLAIQKSRDLSHAALKPNAFDSLNYKRWHAKMVLWLTCASTMSHRENSNSVLQMKKHSRFSITYYEASWLVFVLTKNIVDIYMTLPTRKESW